MKDHKKLNPNMVDSLLEGMPEAMKRVIVGELAGSAMDSILSTATLVHRLKPHMEALGMFDDPEDTPEHLKGISAEMGKVYGAMDDLYALLEEQNERAKERLRANGELDEDGNIIKDDDPCPICGATRPEDCPNRRLDTHDGQDEATDDPVYHA